ncbi:MAG: hypothetical protein WC149_08355 [Arcobacteraceae bacterium]
MTYHFWDNFNAFLPYELQMKFDVRLCNIIAKLEYFFKNAMIHPLQKEHIKVFLAGSCIKEDTFRDIDLIFPNKQDKDDVNNTLNQNYFEYENNSYTYRFEEDIFQLVFREKFENATLNYLVDGFDFDSTKIAFECVFHTQTKQFEIINCDIREEFVHYIHTKVNRLSKISVNPFVSLQRAIHFLKRGDDVPYGVFLAICTQIAKIEVNQDDEKEKYFERLQGNEEKLKDIKLAISQFVEEKKSNE